MHGSQRTVCPETHYGADACILLFDQVCARFGSAVNHAHDLDLCYIHSQAGFALGGCG